MSNAHGPCQGPGGRWEPGMHARPTTDEGVPRAPGARGEERGPGMSGPSDHHCRPVEGWNVAASGQPRDGGERSRGPPPRADAPNGLAEGRRSSTALRWRAAVPSSPAIGRSSQHRPAATRPPCRIHRSRAGQASTPAHSAHGVLDSRPPTAFPGVAVDPPHDRRRPHGLKACWLHGSPRQPRVGLGMPADPAHLPFPAPDLRARPGPRPSPSPPVLGSRPFLSAPTA